MTMIADELRTTMQCEEIVTGIVGLTKFQVPFLITSSVSKGRCAMPSAAKAAPPLTTFLKGKNEFDPRKGATEAK